MFITIEGCEGSGKSTQARRLLEFLESQGVETILTREPGNTGSNVGTEIRNILLENEGLERETQLYLFLANRSEHVAKIIQPAIEEGYTVVCDRYSDSTYAYQIHGLPDLGFELCFTALHCGTCPDLTIWLDVPLASTLGRIQKRMGNNHIDEKPIDFHQRVYEGFACLNEIDPGRFKRVDGRGSQKKVFERVMAIYLDAIGGVP